MDNHFLQKNHVSDWSSSSPSTVEIIKTLPALREKRHYQPRREATLLASPHTHAMQAMSACLQVDRVWTTCSDIPNKVYIVLYDITFHFVWFRWTYLAMHRLLNDYELSICTNKTTRYLSKSTSAYLLGIHTAYVQCHHLYTVKML